MNAALVSSSMVRAKLLQAVLLAVLVAIVGVLVIAPFLTVIFASLITDLPFSGNPDIQWTLANYVQIWTPEFATAIGNTLILAGCGTAMAMAIGCTLAWLAARTDIPFNSGVRLIGFLPLVVSLVVAAVTWSFIGSGRTGYLNIILSSLGVPFRLEMRSLGGMIFVVGLYYVPYPFILVYNALTLIHPDLEEAAAIHGANQPRALGRITFPLVRPALLGAGILVFVAIIEDFPVPAILGGATGIRTLSTQIYDLITFTPSAPTQAGAISVLLTVIACAFVYAQRRLLEGKDYRTVTGKGMQHRLTRLGPFKIVAVTFVALYGFVALILPLLALILGATRSTLFVPNAAALFDLQQLSLRPLQNSLNSAVVRDGLKNSLTVAVGTAFFGGALYFLMAVVTHRTTIRGRQILEYLSVAPLALPALVMGIGILWTWAVMPVPVYGTIAVLIIACIARFMPQGYRSYSSSIGQIHEDLEHAALVSGASRARTVWRITLPLMRSAVVSSTLLLAILAVREMTSALFLYTTHTRVFSVVIYEAYQNSPWSTVASLSLIYTTLLAVLAFVGQRWMSPGFRRADGTVLVK